MPVQTRHGAAGGRRRACRAHATGARDKELLTVLGVSSDPTKYTDLTSQQRKFVQFAIAEHCDELPLLPLMPVRLATLL